MAINRLQRLGAKPNAEGPGEESGSRSEELPTEKEEPASEPEETT
jgi:hypothetical protein